MLKRADQRKRTERKVDVNREELLTMLFLPRTILTNKTVESPPKLLFWTLCLLPPPSHPSLSERCVDPDIFEKLWPARGGQRRAGERLSLIKTVTPCCCFEISFSVGMFLPTSFWLKQKKKNLLTIGTATLLSVSTQMQPLCQWPRLLFWSQFTRSLF